MSCVTTLGAVLTIVLTLLAFAVNALYHAYRNGKLDKDMFLVARSSQTYGYIAWSLYSSGMGSWILYSIPEVGFSYGAWGIAGYALANACPMLVLALVGPKIRKYCPHGITLTDFLDVRFGLPMRYLISLICLFYMYVFMVVEMTGIGLLANALAPSLSVYFPIIFLAVVTCVYTTIGGMPVTMITDKYQGFLGAVLTIIASITLFAGNSVDSAELKAKAKLTGDGFIVFLVLIVAVTAANFFNTAAWQRAWSAKTESALVVGSLLAALLTVVVSVVLGLVGLWAAAFGTTEGAFAFFDLLAPLNCAWSYVVMILAVALVASVVDTLQNSITAELAQDLAPFGVKLIHSRILALVITAPAIVLAAYQFDMLSLFLLADLVATTCAIPAVLGFVKFTNPVFAFLGCIAGMLAVLIQGWVSSETFVGGFEQFVLPDGLYSVKSLYSFLFAMGASAVVTIGGSLFFPDRRNLDMFNPATYNTNAQTSTAYALSPLGKSPSPV